MYIYLYYIYILYIYLYIIYIYIYIYNGTLEHNKPSNDICERKIYKFYLKS